MYETTRSLKHVRQDRADLDAKITQLRVEGRKLMAVAPDKRTHSQVTRLDSIEAEIDTLSREAATVAAELATLERSQAAEIAEHVSGGPRIIQPSRGRRYAEMFGAQTLSMDGFRSAEEYLSVLHSGLSDQRLQATMTERVDSDGGFSVPNQVFQTWLDASLEDEIVRSRADVYSMKSSDASVPGWDDTSHSSTLYGGFSGQWVDETGTITETAPKLRLINLHVRKLAILTSASNELIADGVSFEEQLGQKITKALGWFLDLAFFSGNGASAPAGILNSSATISVAKETGQAAGTIVYANITKMFARMLPSSIDNAVWVCNSTAIPQLLQMSLPVGTGGSHFPVLSESGGSWRMLTRPVLFTEKVPAVGTVGDIGLYDFSQYAVGLRQSFTLAKSGHVGFASDTSHYRGIIRVDGQAKLNTPITPKYGDTQSPFVVLATRA